MDVDLVIVQRYRVHVKSILLYIIVPTFLSDTNGAPMFLYLYPFYPLLDYSGYDCAVSICCQQNATVDLYVIVRYFRWKISLEQAQ